MPLPSLPAPTEKPDQPFRVALLTWIIFTLGSRKVLALPRRDVQLVFSRVSGSLVSDHLAGLVAEGWLARPRQARSETYSYALGNELVRAPRRYADWEALSVALWGSCGLLGTYEDPTVLGHKMFGVSGMLCLVAVVDCESPVSVSELHSCLKFFMSRQTASRRLRSLVADGLLEESGRRYTARADWRSRLDDIVATYPSGNKRRIQLVDDIAGERLAYAKVIADGHLTRRDRYRILQGACVDCGGDSAEVEHFPPIKHGGFDHIHVAFPICERCNNDLSPFIKWLPETPRNECCTVHVAPGVDPCDHLRASVLHNRKRFIDAFYMWETATTRRELRRARNLAMEAIRFAYTLLHHLKRNGRLTRTRRPGSPCLSGPREGRRDGRIPY